MIPYAEALTAERRLVILQLLAQGDGHANERVIMVGLRAMNHRTGVDEAWVREQLRWLAKAECVTTDLAGDNTMLVQLSQRGALVADGSVRCDGVARPLFGT